MAKKRVTVRTGITDVEFQESLANYAAADAALCKINADLDVKITELRRKSEDSLLELAEKRDVALETIKDYAVVNKERLFPKKKSMDTSHGVIGFRTGTPKLKTLKGFTWESVTNLLKVFLPDYVRSVEEPAKDKLLADRDNEAVLANMKNIGVQVIQDESFFIELKKEITDKS